MKKIISFSLFGEKPKYIVGLYKNLELVEKFYPEWETVIYYDETLPEKYTKELQEKVYKMIDMTGNFVRPKWLWRHFVHDLPETERFIVRDADSRITQREVDAVNAWIKSNKIMHLMRDHPHHGYKIMGGMWGMIRQPNFNIQQACEEYSKKKNNKNRDMYFLRDIVYPRYLHSSKVHASYAKFEDWAEDFPSELVDKKFVGEIWNEDDSREYQYTLI